MHTHSHLIKTYYVLSRNCCMCIHTDVWIYTHIHMLFFQGYRKKAPQTGSVLEAGTTKFKCQQGGVLLRPWVRGCSVNLPWADGLLAVAQSLACRSIIRISAFSFTGHPSCVPEFPLFIETPVALDEGSVWSRLCLWQPYFPIISSSKVLGIRISTWIWCGWGGGRHNSPHSSAANAWAEGVFIGNSG